MTNEVVAQIIVDQKNITIDDFNALHYTIASVLTKSTQKLHNTKTYQTITIPIKHNNNIRKSRSLSTRQDN